MNIINRKEKMASPGVMIEEQRYRPPESKSSKSPKSRSSSLKHKTRFPASAVKESEQSLNQLLEDFEGGRLNAFGNSDMLQKMNEIREMQEKLTLRHFEIDQMRISQESKAGRAEDKGEAPMLELTQALERLGTAIQSLHSSDSKRADGGKQKKVSIKMEEPETAPSGRITPL